jgi:hypothetical protein
MFFCQFSAEFADRKADIYNAVIALEAVTMGTNAA